MNDSLYSPGWYRIAGLKPKLRKHCQIHRHQYREQTWYVLEDKLTGRFHRFPGHVYWLIALMDGRRSMQDIWQAALEKFGDDAPSQQEVMQLLIRLYQIDVLQTDVIPVVQEMQRRANKTLRQKRVQFLKSPLSIRIPLFDPDRLLTALSPWLKPCFSRLGWILWLLSVMLGLLLAGRHWPALSENVVDRTLSLENLALLWFVYPLLKALHELGHGLAVKRWGGEVHEFGVMLLVFMPMPYVDASASTAFENKWQRMMVAAAGLMVELSLAVIALLVWLNAEPGMIRAIAFNVMLIAGVSALLFNGNPLLRYDSYYILSDWLEIPNLGQRANHYIGYLFQRYLLGLSDVPSPVKASGEAKWLFFYAIASFCYRLLMMYAIILLVGGRYFIIGALLAAWALVSMLIIPFYKALKGLFKSPYVQPVKQKVMMRLSVFALAMALLLLLAPVPVTVQTEGVVWQQPDSQIRAEEEGEVLMVVVKPGTMVKPGDELMRLGNLQVSTDVRVYQAQLHELEWRYQQQRTENLNQAQITREKIASVQGLLTRALERQQNLQVTSPLNGQLVIPKVQDLPGRYVRRGELLAYVFPQDRQQWVRIVVDQEQADRLLSAGVKAEVRYASFIDRVYPASLIRAVPAASAELPSPALTTEGGGQYAAIESESGQMTAIKRLFQFDLAVPLSALHQRLGERVYVRFVCPPESLAMQAFRAFRQLFLSQFHGWIV